MNWRQSSMRWKSTTWKSNFCSLQLPPSLLLHCISHQSSNQLRLLLGQGIETVMRSLLNCKEKWLFELNPFTSNFLAWVCVRSCDSEVSDYVEFCWFRLCLITEVFSNFLKNLKNRKLKRKRKVLLSNLTKKFGMCPAGLTRWFKDKSYSSDRQCRV